MSETPRPGDHVVFRGLPQGSWTPAWEGRVCTHVSGADILDYFGYELRDGKFVKKIVQV